MAGKTDFTEAEWQTLEKGVTGAAMLVAAADPNFFDSFKEVGTMAGHLAEARQKSSSQLIRTWARQHNRFRFARRRSARNGALRACDVRASPDETEAYSAFVLSHGVGRAGCSPA
jgi:hypothetical protein